MNPIVRGCVGVVVGAALGVAVYYVLMRFVGLNGIMVIGLGAGIGASMGRAPGFVVPIFAGLVAAVTGVLAEWWQAPFVADASLGFFLRNLDSVARGDMLMIVIGVAAAVYFAWTGSTPATARAATSTQTER